MLSLKPVRLFAATISAFSLLLLWIAAFGSEGPDGFCLTSAPLCEPEEVFFRYSYNNPERTPNCATCVSEAELPQFQAQEDQWRSGRFVRRIQYAFTDSFDSISALLSACFVLVLTVLFYFVINRIFRTSNSP